MRTLLAALFATALALLQGWAGVACACEEETIEAQSEQVARLVAACCCCGEQSCPALADEAPSGASPAEILVPGPSLAVMAALSPSLPPAPTARSLDWPSTLARGPPGPSCSLWLKNSSLRR